MSKRKGGNPKNRRGGGRVTPKGTTPVQTQRKRRVMRVIASRIPQGQKGRDMLAAVDAELDRILGD